MSQKDKKEANKKKERARKREKEKVEEKEKVPATKRKSILGSFRKKVQA